MSDIARFGVVIDTTGARAGQVEFERSVDSIKNKAREGGRAMDSMAESTQKAYAQIKAFAAFAGLTIGVSQLIRYTDSWKQMEGQLRLVTKTSKEAEEVQQKLFKVAQDTRAPLSETIGLYSRMARSTKDLKLTQDELISITKAVNQALVISGSSAASAGGSMLQLGQAFASGTLRGDELNSILEGMPRLAEAIAAGMGRSTGELRKLGSQGKITSEEMAKAILQQSKVLADEYAKMPQTVSQALTQINNAMQQFIGETDKSLGVSNGLVTVLKSLADNFDKLAIGIEIAAVAYGGKFAASFAKASSEYVRQGAVKIAALAAQTSETARLAVGEEIAAHRALAAANANAILAASSAESAITAKAQATALQATAVASGELAVAANAAAVASSRATAAIAATSVAARIGTATVGVFNAVLTALGGWIGIAITAAIVALTALYSWWNKHKIAAQENKKAADELKQSMALLETQMASSLLVIQKNTKANDDLYTLLMTKGITAYEAAKKQQDVVKSATAVWDRYKEGVGRAAKTLGTFTEELAKGNPQAVALNKAMTEEAASSDRLEQGLKRSTKAREDSAAAMKAQKDKAADLAKQFKEEKQASDEAVEAIKREVNGLANLLEAKKGGEDAYARVSLAMQREDEIRAALNKALPNEKQNVVDLVRRKYELLDATDKLNLARKKEADATEAFNEKIRASVQQTADLVSQKLDEAKSYRAEIARQAAQPFENALKGIQTAFSSFFESIMTDGLKSFESLAEGIKRLFVRMMSEIAAQKMGQQLMGSVMMDGYGAPKRDAAGNLMRSGGWMQTAGGGYAAIGVSSALAGYSVGSQTTNKGIGAVGGALAGAGTGAAIGSVVPVIGTAIGAVVGAVVGLVGGLIGSANAAKKSNEALKVSQNQVQSSLEGLRASMSNDKLGQAIAETKKQFDTLREAALQAYAGRKNEGGRAIAIAEINRLEAERIAIIKAEFDAGQKKLQQDYQIRELIAQGRTEEAENLAFVAAQQEEYNTKLKEGATAATLASLSSAQLAEAMRRNIEKTEEMRRTLFDLTNGAQAFTDPRGASEASFIESQNRRIWDAIHRGANEAELAAIRFFNAAEKAAREAQILENDTRTREGLLSRGLSAQGNAQAADDVAFRAQQRQEMADAIAAGMSPSNIALLRFIQFSEASARQMQQAIQDGTKAIQDAAAKEIKVVNDLIDAVQTAAAEQIKAIDEQIEKTQLEAKATAKRFDDQISAVREAAQAQLASLDVQIVSARAALDATNQQINLLDRIVQTNQKVVDALTSFADSLKMGELSTLSPEQKYAEARSRFNALAGSAAGGNADAATALPDAANTLLQASRAFFASTQGYVSDYNTVQDTVDQLTKQYGKTLPVDIQTLEAAKQTVIGLQTSIDVLNKQRDAIQDAADRQIDALQTLKDKAAEDAQRALDKLNEQKEQIGRDAQATIDRLIETRTAIETAAQQQIDELVKLQTEAHLTRLRQDEYWQTFLGLSGQSDPLGPGGNGPGGPAETGGSMFAVPQALLDTQRETIDVLGAKLDEVEEATTAAVTKLDMSIRVLQEGFSRLIEASAVAQATAEQSLTYQRRTYNETT